MINKKGEEESFLSNNALSLIIVALGLAILIFGIVKLYYANANQELKSAGNVLDGLIDKIELFKEGESNKFFLQSFSGGNNWYLIGWSKGEEGRPDKCFFDSCICICKGNDKNLFAIAKIYLEKDKIRSENEIVKYFSSACQSGGICRKVKYSELSLISTRPYDYMNYKGKISYSFIGLESPLNEVQVEVGKDKLNILANPKEFS